MKHNLKTHSRANNFTSRSFKIGKVTTHQLGVIKTDQFSIHMSSSYHVLTCKNFQQSGILYTQLAMSYFFLFSFFPYNMSNHSLLLLLIDMNVFQQIQHDTIEIVKF
jgi:hypothetical protein